MAPRAPLLVQTTTNRESHQSTEHVQHGDLRHGRLRATTLIKSKNISSHGDTFFGFLGLSGMGDKPVYEVSSFEDDPLAEIAQQHPEPTHPLVSTSTLSLSPLTQYEWYQIRTLYTTPSLLLPLEGKWDPLEAWLADRNRHEQLWELISVNNDESNGEEGYEEQEEIEEKVEVIDMEKGKEKVDGGGGDDDGDDNEPLTRSIMESSVDTLKSTMRKLKNIASPEGSVIAGKDHEGKKWPSLFQF